MLKQFEDLTAAQEALFMEDGVEGSDADVTARVEVELEVAKDAEDEAEVVEEAAEVEEGADQNAELMRSFDNLMNAYKAVKQFGYSQPLAMMIDPEGRLSELFPAIPATESLDVVGTPTDATTQYALEAIGAHLKKFWQAIKDFCKWIKDKAMALFAKVKALFDSRAQMVTKLSSAIKSANIDSAKCHERDVKLMSPSDWDKAAGSLQTKGSELATHFAKLAAQSLEGDRSWPTLELKFDTLPDGKSEKLEWDKVSIDRTAAAAKSLCELVSRGMPKSAASIKSMAARLDAFATKNAGSDEEVSVAKKSASANSAVMKALIKEANTFSSHANKLVGIWLTAAKHVLACKKGKVEGAVAKKAE